MTVAHYGLRLHANGDQTIVLANPEQADVIAGIRVAGGDKFDHNRR